MRRALFACMAGVALIGAAPAFDVRGSIDIAGELLEQGKTKEAFKLLEGARKAATTPRERAAVAVSQAVFRHAAGERAAGLKAFEEAQALAADDPFVAEAMYRFGQEAGDLDLAVRGLDRLIASYPDVARDLEPTPFYNVLNGLFQTGRKDEDRAMRARLGRIGFGGDNVAVRDAFAFSAIKDHMARGEHEEAGRIAATVVDREALVTLLTNRRYEALWPGIEARVGDRMEQASAAALISAERLFKAQPDNVETRAALVTALVDAGREAEAEKLAAAFANTPEQLKSINEAGGWLINHHARILRSLKRTEDADARMAQLADLDIAEKTWLISMRINRFIGLIKNGKLDQAAPLLTEAAPLAQRYGSPYARQLVRTHALCHAMMQKRQADATAMLPDVLAHEADGRTATAEALMCLGHTDEAAKRVLALLEDENQRDGMIGNLQTDTGDDSDGPNWPGDLGPLRARADVRSAFDKAGRDLPTRLRHES